MGTYTDLLKLKRPKRDIKPDDIDLDDLPPMLSRPSPTLPLNENKTSENVDEHLNRRTPEQVNARTGERPNRRTGERVISRQSYNVYEDQHTALKRLEARSAMSGKKSVPISEMVRQALDDYLNKPR